MTSKADFSETAWKQIMALPALAGVYISTSDPRGFDVIKEGLTMGRAIQKEEAPAAAADLVKSLVDDIVQNPSEMRDAMKLQPRPGSAEEARASLENRLSQGLDALATQATSDEMQGFKQWLLAIAQAVAEAAKEGGFLGFGGERVTEKEQAALNELKNLLGISKV